MSVMNFLFYHELSNFRIVSSHGVSRMVVGLALHANGGYSSLSIGQYGESVSDDHRSGWNCCLASPEIFPFKSPPISMYSELPDVMIR